MKKKLEIRNWKLIILFSTFCFLFFASFSQNKNLNKAISYFEGYEKYNETATLPLAKENIDLASANETTSGKYKTWFFRGKIYLALFENTLRNEMNKSKEADINKKYLEAYRHTPVAELDESLLAFQKEMKLDEKKIYSDDAQAGISSIIGHYNGKAYYSLLNKNYSDAVLFYEKSYQLKLSRKIVDTVAVNNLAFAVFTLKDYPKAEQYYTQLIELGYKPEKCYLTMIQMYNDAADTASVKRIITKAVVSFPDSYDLLVEQINFFLKQGETEEAIRMLRKAIEKNPDNHELHLVLGKTYTKTNNIKEAEEEFLFALQIKSDCFMCLYSLAVLYNNAGAVILKQSENLNDITKIKDMEKQADAWFFKAIPFLEKANQIDSADKDTLRLLLQLYARTGQSNSDKYKQIEKQLKISN